MKKTNKPTRITINASSPLSEAALHFLDSRPLSSNAGSIASLTGILRKVALRLGHLPVASVTPAQLDAAVSTPTLTASGRRSYVTVLRHFFRWLQIQGCLPLCRPTAADHLPLPSSSTVSSPLCSADLRKLLTLAKDVEVRLYLAVSVFAGLRPQELLNLSWEDVAPGATMVVNSKCNPFRRVVAICPTLDAWLRPFYGAKGPLVSSSCRGKVLRLARESQVRLRPNILRHTFGEMMLAVNGNAKEIAAAMGINSASLHRHFTSRMSEAEARQILSLTPETMGFFDWSQQATDWLKSSAMRHVRAQKGNDRV